MLFYPKYGRQEVLAEYALSFYTLLNEAYRSQQRNYLMLTNIALMSIASPEQRKEFTTMLEWASSRPGDILKSSGRGSTDEEIQKALGG